MDKIKNKKNVYFPALLHPQSVLLIADDLSLCKTMQQMITPFHRVKVASSGREAMNILQEYHFQFDMIICVLNMLETTGIDVYYFLAKQNKKIEDRIIFITTASDWNQCSLFLTKVNNLCVNQPFSKEDLLRAMMVMALTKLPEYQ